MCRAFSFDSACTAWVIHSFAPQTQNQRLVSAIAGNLLGMGGEPKPFIGTEALASGALTRYELRRYYRAIMPNVYLDKRVEPTLYQRTVGAWLWSGREAVVAGLAASALHRADWIDDDSSVELIWRNARVPAGVITRADSILAEEIQKLDGLAVTSPERTAFDIGRRGRLDDAVARLDALAQATDLKVSAVEELVSQRRNTRGLRQLEAVLNLVDADAESPKETWLRLLVIRAGYPRPRTQIPVLSPDGRRWYYLDMGWENIKLAIEYDGDHHRTTRARFSYEIERAEDLHVLGWTVVKVAARHQPASVLRRVQRAWAVCTC
jgi:very-short-patch-repair endonuclease